MGPVIQVKMEMHSFVCFFVCMWGGWILGKPCVYVPDTCFTRASSRPLPFFRFLIKVYLSLENISNSKEKRKCVYVLKSDGRTIN